MINAKSANSGLQAATWYVLSKELGADYWEKFAMQKPHAFDSQVQQYDAVVNGQDKVVECAEYDGYLLYKEKRAPLEFVMPARGVPATPEAFGIVDKAPHPNAARLFLDWILSLAGQKPFMDAIYQNAARPDAPPPPGGVSLREMKVLFPSDWQDFVASRPAFVKTWQAITGRR